MAINLELRVPPFTPGSGVAQFASQCGVAGFDGVGILDSQMLEGDVFYSMAMAAQATSRIRICSPVLVQCFPHHVYSVRGHHQRRPPEVASVAVVAESNAQVTGGFTLGVPQ